MLRRVCVWAASTSNLQRPCLLAGRYLSTAEAPSADAEDDIDVVRERIDRIKNRGIAKTLKPYVPPQNVESRVSAVIAEHLTDKDISDLSADSADKFKVLSALATEFGHRVPASKLGDMNTLADIVGFYTTEVHASMEYTQLARRGDVPPNVHILEDPVRFDPEDTEAFHGGVTAFPGSSTIALSLRGRRVYPGFRAKSTWHHFEESSGFDHTQPPPDAPWTEPALPRLDTKQAKIVKPRNTDKDGNEL